MIRFLRHNAELITGVCVVLALIIGSTFIYLSTVAQQNGQAQLDAIATHDNKNPIPGKAPVVQKAQAASESTIPKKALSPEEASAPP